MALLTQFAGTVPQSAAPTATANTYNQAQSATHKFAGTQAATAATQATNPNSLASTQLSNITSSNSPLMQQARTSALQFGNRRGLLNSSITAGAAQGAVIRAATPIAQSNAAMIGQQSLSNQRNIQQANLVNAAAINTTNKFNSNAVDNINSLNTKMINQGAQFNAQQSNAIAQGNQNAILSTNKNNNAIQQNLQLQGMRSVGAITQGYLTTYNAIQTDANMNATAKSTALSNLKNQMTNAQTALSAVSGSLANLPSVVWK